MTTIGIVIPAYNAEPYLEQALASIAAQSQRPDRIVVVDDGSDDGSADVAARWCSLLPLEVVRQANAGPARARAAGIERLDTELVALLDSDDVWLPDHLAAMTAAHGGRLDLVTARALRWVPGQALASAAMNPGAVPPPARQLRELILMSFVFAGTLFDRGLYDDVGGFRDRRSGAEDWDLWLRMVAAGAVVTSPGTPTVLYRVRPGSLSADDAALGSEVAVLREFLEEAPPDMIPVVRRSLRHRRGRIALRTAYDLARERRPWAARVAGTGALLGPAAVRRRALALLIAPQLLVRWRDTNRADPRREVRR